MTAWQRPYQSCAAADRLPKKDKKHKKQRCNQVFAFSVSFLFLKENSRGALLLDGVVVFHVACAHQELMRPGRHRRTGRSRSVIRPIQEFCSGCTGCFWEHNHGRSASSRTKGDLNALVVLNPGEL